MYYVHSFFYIIHIIHIWYVAYLHICVLGTLQTSNSNITWKLNFLKTPTTRKQKQDEAVGHLQTGIKQFSKVATPYTAYFHMYTYIYAYYKRFTFSMHIYV